MLTRMVFFMNKIPNDPTLFVNSVTDKKDSNENQCVFDSRNKPVRKKVARYRLEDINAMLLYKINILCEIRTKQRVLEGVVSYVDDKYLQLIIDNKKINIDIDEIEDINILKL